MNKQGNDTSHVVCVALIVVAAALGVRGFGHTDWFSLTVAVFIGICVYESVRSKRYLAVAGLLILGAIIQIFPEYSQLAMIVALFPLTMGASGVAASTIIIGQAVIWKFGWTSRLATPVFVLVASLIFGAFLTLIPGTLRRWLLTCMCILWLIPTAKEIINALRQKSITIENYKIEGVQVFPHGHALSRTLSGELVKKGEAKGDLGIVNLIFGDTKNVAAKEVYLVEHGVYPSENHPDLRREELRQIKPWEGNQLFGDEHILASISQDGYWASNLGGSLQPKGKVRLGSVRHEGGGSFEPLMIETGNRIYIQDSDPLVDWLAHGQRHIIYELIIGQVGFRLIGVFGLFSILVMVYRDERLWSKSAFIGIIIAITAHIGFDRLMPREGDVLILGTEGGPHELSRSAGVMRSMLENGHDLVDSNRPARVVVLSRNQRYKVRGVEKLIILSSGARLQGPNGWYEAAETPHGTVDGILDTRLIIGPNGEKKPVHRLPGLTILGTDSPAKLDWNTWLPR
jgi:hypothetical protein